MKKFNTKEIKVIALNLLFDLQDDHPEFADWWENIEAESRESLADLLSESLIAKFRVEE